MSRPTAPRSLLSRAVSSFKPTQHRGRTRRIDIWLRGDSGKSYYHADDSANVVTVNERVAVGQVTAYVGDTGNAVGWTLASTFRDSSGWRPGSGRSVSHSRPVVRVEPSAVSDR